MANVLGINLEGSGRQEIWEKIEDFLKGEKTRYIVTPNPEIILASHHDEELFYILNQADLSLADGFGLQIAALINREGLERLTGADLSLELLAKAEKRGYKVMILSWDKGLSSEGEIKTALNHRYPRLDFSVLAVSRDTRLQEEQARIINAYSPKIVFVLTGCPYQEKLICHSLGQWPSVRLAVGVGGAFDFITGAIKRAPSGLRQIGLEWLWRLIQQPWRWKRIYNATFVFLAKVIKVRFINPHLYRPNVACLLYKKETGKIKVIIVERRDESGHWQLPQGGRDGESVAKSGARELREEVGVDKITIKAIFKNVFRYDFTRVSKLRGEKRPHFQSRRYQNDFRGQKQSLFVAEFLGQDSEIKINYWDHRAWQWVDIEQLLNLVSPTRREATAVFLEKFKTLNIK